MPESDPSQILLAHDRWATEQVLDACGRLEAEQFHRRFEIGFGSLHDTLTHIVAAMRALTETLANAEPRRRLDEDGRKRTPAQLRELLEASWREFSTESRRRPLDETVTRTMRSGKTLTLTRAAVLVHITTHGTHHRAQCLNMLRRLGVTPLPPVSVAEWTWLGETQG